MRHYVRFSCHEINVGVTALLAGPVKVVNHHPEGWQAVQRMWRRSFTEWQGAQGYELQMPLVFDAWMHDPQRNSSRNSVEGPIIALQRLCEKLDNKPRTPIFTFDAGGYVPHDYTHDHTKLWVVQAVDWGDYLINKNHGQRTRQPLTLTIWEWIPDQVAQSNNRFPTRPVPKTYRIKRGDTLIKIAVYFYGDGSKWRDIARLNRLQNPNHPKVGKVIKLPR